MHIINATTPEVGNWMRYVNCARFYEEQNIISVQEGGEIFYEALKVCGYNMLLCFVRNLKIPNIILP